MGRVRPISSEQLRTRPLLPSGIECSCPMALESARTLLYNPVQHLRREGGVIEQAVIDEGVRLTVVGMGTAFALLVVLTLIVTLMGAAFRWAAGRGVAREDPAARDRAVAAAGRRRRHEGPVARRRPFGRSVGGAS